METSQHSEREAEAFFSFPPTRSYADFTYLSGQNAGWAMIIQRQEQGHAPIPGSAQQFLMVPVGQDPCLGVLPLPSKT